MAAKKRKISIGEAAAVWERQSTHERKVDGKYFMEKDDEEDSQISSSLPQYLASVFGWKDKQSVDTDQTNQLHSISNTKEINELSPVLFDSDSHMTKSNSIAADIETNSITIEKHISQASAYNCPPECCCLSECNEMIGKTVSFLVIVTQVNPCVEVVLKKNGQVVSMASLILSDPTLLQFKLTLWRDSATWSERISAGDVILFSAIRLKQWRGEVVGHTVSNSRVLNLHQVPKKLPDKVLNYIPEHSISEFMKWARKEHFYLFSEIPSIPKSQRIIKFHNSSNLPAESFTHFRGRILSLVAEKTVSLTDDPSIIILLFLVGKNKDLWLKQLKERIGQVWEVLNVLVLPEGTQAGCPCLQTTTRTTFHCLKPNSLLATKISQQFNGDGRSHCVQNVNIEELLKMKGRGCYCIRATPTVMRFIVADDRQDIDILKFISDPIEMISLLSQAVYIGCSSCTKPLIMDENKVYCICRVCMERYPGASPGSVHYFRPLLIHLSDETGSEIDVTSYHYGVTQLFTVIDVTPDQISLVIGNEKQMLRMGKRICERLYHITDTNSNWTLCLNVSTDENSFVMSLQCTLLEWNNN